MIVDPKDHNLFHNKGVTLNKLGRYKEAIQSFKSGIILKSNDPSIYSNLGVSYYKIKEYEQSLIYYDE